MPRRSRATQPTESPPSPGPVPETVGSALQALLPQLTNNSPVPAWPPDVYALTATLLVRSCAYCRVLEEDWPGPGRKREDWPGEAARIGLAWRQAWVESQTPPEPVPAWWKEVLAAWDLPLSSISGRPDVWNALFALCAVADSTCDGIGRPWAEPGTKDQFLLEAEENLLPHPQGSTLNLEIDHSRSRVLPKLHTPQSGLTIRSFTHSLALCPGQEVRPEWHTPITASTGELSLNLLLVPWPFLIRASQFAATRVPPLLASGLPDQPGLFTFVPSQGEPEFPEAILSLLTAAVQHIGRIDGLVLPELALTSSQQSVLSARLFDPRGSHGSVLFWVSGVAGDGPASPSVAGKNIVHLDMGPNRPSLRQSKHHRWCLDRSQIEQYGLGTTLYPNVSWWEHILLQDRKIVFLAVRSWLTMCVLICEDLARPDPAGELLRAVGPNLVIALLMDAPQLAHRWPGRYATVLADDPGSSVLTLTSLGMAELSRPRSGANRSRVIGLWKDAQSGVVEIELPPGKKAVILNTTYGFRDELTVDGRRSLRRPGLPVLSGIHFV